MTNIMGASAKLSLGFGQAVTKTSLAITAISTKPVFTVAGGRVLITSLSGVVTTIFQAQANAAKFVATPTVGTVNDISATVETNGLIVGALIGVTGLAADAMVVSTGGAISNLRNPFIVNTGTIGYSTAASSTGAVTITCTYIPLDATATVVAA